MLRWLTLYTKPKMERHAADALAARSIEAFLPVVHEYSTHYRRKEATPFFPCYLFARVEPASADYLALNWTPGLRGVVRFQGEAAWARRAGKMKHRGVYLEERLALLEVVRLAEERGQI